MKQRNCLFTGLHENLAQCENIPQSISGNVVLKAFTISLQFFFKMFNSLENVGFAIDMHHKLFAYWGDTEYWSKRIPINDMIQMPDQFAKQRETDVQNIRT